ncbi:RNA polymerase subunit sigma-24 [[Pantoea] beijingensis]|uniref:RNA polymerase subunit sigma-24 n=2 Tax=[Pantoea] beijingensis TaxID=1324864 RepID=A0A443IE11_9GAMM|nr:MULTISPECIES: RNA polymerase sigma factor [Erwiniaceae]RWR02147.1 RNA polymerase subunit sigma-24 [[Pantoea] beijingensis]
MTIVDIRAELDQYLARLWRYAMVLSHKRDIADDLVQMTCVRAIEKSAQFMAGSHLDRWLFSILHSIWINHVRSQHFMQQQRIDDVELSPDETGHHDETDHLWARQIMLRVNRLPEAQRNAVFLVYVEGFTYQEAADTLSVPIGTIMSRLANARRTLAKDVADPQPTRKREGLQ